eukprot:TRINITY_DN330_c0_g1_i1.p1 TRINITY_DN330_c0_g1~~TRINITY_DN330_c0_g1_i1.p1  ORF type:complete len:282 (-),score=39.29 TRINITY_DN330_c0_g1_i1:1298-2143(-)
MAYLAKAAASQGLAGTSILRWVSPKPSPAATWSPCSGCGGGPLRFQQPPLQRSFFGEGFVHSTAFGEGSRVRENNGGAACQSHEGEGARSMAGDFQGDSSVRNSFGNECTIIKTFRQELETKADYQKLRCSLTELEEDLDRLVKAENYEEAIELRDRVRMLALQKRMMEISVQPQTMYRIGDVIVHKKYGYRGVIYGHDLECSAPEGWQQQMKIDSLPEGRKQPFYHVLVDVRDRPGGMSTYVAQENMSLQPTPRPVLHPWTNMVRRRRSGLLGLGVVVSS